MPGENLTPEENLLRIIESPGQAPRGGHGMGRSRRGIDPRTQLRLIRKAVLERAQKIFTLRTANISLMAAGGAATLFLVLDFWVGLPKSDFLDNLEAKARAADLGDLSIGQIGPLPLYVQEIKGRNIFALTAPVPKVPGEETLTPEQVRTQAIQEAIQGIITNYKVVGIIWAETPQAIIEDVGGGHTFMVSRGSLVKVARVKDILKDRVILSYDDKEIELR